MSLLDWIYPPKCMACQTILMPVHNSFEKYLCANCKSLFVPIADPFCLRCGHPKKNSSVSTQSSCISCRGKEFYFENHRAAFAYEEVVREMVLNIKFRSKRQVAQGLGWLFADVCKNWNIKGDYIVPIPLHPSKKRMRGFNQATLLAQPIGSVCGIPVANNMMLRIKKTPPQSGLSALAREQNLSNAFRCNNKKYNVAGKTIILIDDIFTSGATINACAKCLLESNAAKIYAVSLCITLKGDTD